MTIDRPTSPLDRIIPAEIKDDEFYQFIYTLSANSPIQTVLEIGSSSGEGSTHAFVSGLRENPNHPQLFCLEVSKPRFDQLRATYESDGFVHCYNSSSVPVEAFPTASEVVQFYQSTPTNLNASAIESVLEWLQQDIQYVLDANVNSDGIQQIKQNHTISTFDVVLIDGSEFTGAAELDAVWGARLILLDDINSFKNYHNHHQLLRDRQYKLLVQNTSLRNGYSVFERIAQPSDEPPPMAADHPLPVHFLTIVLNGEPFIHYFLPVFQTLPFPWHWHIVEGVASLVHDTAWSLSSGGQISEHLHQQGLSHDGTTAYLDEIAAAYPTQVTVYRKPTGLFWDGKREMVNEPLFNITQECVLWQVDVDELWTREQLVRGRQLFLDRPEKTAAYYWCWYFVGEGLMISSRYNYAQNPQQDWLRSWRFQPGDRWLTHEPPRLWRHTATGWQDVAAIDSLNHAETEAAGLVFQHFAYLLPEQLQFKEHYYGYTGALAAWRSLQAQTRFPVRLRQFFSWVQDGTLVDQAASWGVVPIVQRDATTGEWIFLDSPSQPRAPQRPTPLIAIDGVFFQLYKTGIARVWRSLLEQWAESGFSQHVIVLDRAVTAADVAGIHYVTIAPYDPRQEEADRSQLQQICDQWGVDVFISTYFTTPLSTPSVLMLYDMIPEAMGESINHPLVQRKRRAIAQASDYLAISQNTAKDVERFCGDLLTHSVKVAHCGVDATFTPASEEELATFKHRYGITKPYFLVTSADNPSPYKNNALFFHAFAKLASKTGFEVVCTVLSVDLPAQWREQTAGCVVHLLRLSDAELAIAYSGAIALVYPSKYEGFGMPVLEAMACGCPVITCANASIPEVAGTAALYVPDQDASALAEALCEVQKPIVRHQCIQAGLARAAQFSWARMAETVAAALVEASLLKWNLRAINLIVWLDWQRSPEDLYAGLAAVVATVLSHPDRAEMTLLIDASELSDTAELDFILTEIVLNWVAQAGEEALEAEEPEIAIVNGLSPLQWQALSARLSGYIRLNDDKPPAIAHPHRLPPLTLAEVSHWRLHPPSLPQSP
ncbi:MAG: glycosyltransferase family 4 protein [Leptolyngbyaceae cyanobacterium SL_7_1]|nr:glycosyltransferase family 4 protein [Leptolyngbyaceae cyanobacterium SL_7_1]